MNDSKTGFGEASMLLGYVTFAQAQEPAKTNAASWYSGLYVNDSFRYTPKLTINAGLRWSSRVRSPRRRAKRRPCCSICRSLRYLPP